MTERIKEPFTFVRLMINRFLGNCFWKNRVIYIDLQLDTFIIYKYDRNITKNNSCLKTLYSQLQTRLFKIMSSELACKISHRHRSSRLISNFPRIYNVYNIY